MEKVEKPISFVATPTEIVEMMVELVKDRKDTAILDTGCGKGAFLECLVAQGYRNIDAIELNEEFVNYCSNKYKGVKVVNEDFLSWETKKRYDVIIGNPPYLHYNSLPEEVQEKVRTITKTKESDIYYAFILKSIDLLKEEGEIIYIVPYGFFYATHAKYVREKLLENGYIDTIIDLDEVRIFIGENPETVIFRYIKTNKEIKNTPTRIIKLKGKKAPLGNIRKQALKSMKQEKSNSLFEYHRKELNDRTSLVWSTHKAVAMENYTLLKELAFVGVGMVSGFEQAFKLEEYENTEQYHSSEVVYPFIKAKNCKGYWTEGYTSYLLFDEVIKEEEELKQKYPKYYNKILEFKEPMSNRHLPSNKQWFNWQALRNFNEYKKMLKKEKIVTPTLDRSKNNRFSLINQPLYPSGDVNVIIPLTIDPYFLLGYLNSSFFRKYYLSEGARRGHRIAYTQRILAHCKIPNMEKEKEEEIAKLTKKIVNKKNKEYKKEIDAIINQITEKNKNNFPK